MKNKSYKNKYTALNFIWMVRIRKRYT